MQYAVDGETLQDIYQMVDIATVIQKRPFAS